MRPSPHPVPWADLREWPPVEDVLKRNAQRRILRALQDVVLDQVEAEAAERVDKATSGLSAYEAERWRRRVAGKILRARLARA